jgi:hypothetical protein
MYLRLFLTYYYDKPRLGESYTFIIQAVRGEGGGGGVGYIISAVEILS